MFLRQAGVHRRARLTHADRGHLADISMQGFSFSNRADLSSEIVEYGFEYAGNSDDVKLSRKPSDILFR
jgi:hypothetical protein